MISIKYFVKIVILTASGPIITCGVKDQLIRFCLMLDPPTNNGDECCSYLLDWTTSIDYNELETKELHFTLLSVSEG